MFSLCFALVEEIRLFEANVLLDFRKEEQSLVQLSEKIKSERKPLQSRKQNISVPVQVKTCKLRAPTGGQWTLVVNELILLV